MFVKFTRGILKDQLVPVLVHIKGDIGEYVLIDHNQHEIRQIKYDYMPMNGKATSFTVLYSVDGFDYKDNRFEIGLNGFAWHNCIRKENYFEIELIPKDNLEALSLLRKD